MGKDITRLIDKTTEEYLRKVLEVNKTINLTNIVDFNEAKVLLLEDSISVLQELDEAPDGLYGDLGSGGGFPGVPLAIASKRKTILIDSVSKKMNAIQNIINELNVSNISTYDKRIEELALESPSSFSVLTAKGLAKLPSVLELASPLLKLNGHLIALKSHEEKTFYNPSLEYKLGMQLVKERDYSLSDSSVFRKVYVFEKFKEPEIKLPRRVGMAQKRPYKN